MKGTPMDIDHSSAVLPGQRAERAVALPTPVRRRRAVPLWSLLLRLVLGLMLVGLGVLFLARHEPGGTPSPEPAPAPAPASPAG